MQISKDRIKLAPIDVTMLEKGNSRCTMTAQTRIAKNAMDVVLTNDIQSGFMKIVVSKFVRWSKSGLWPVTLDAFNARLKRLANDA